MTLIDCNSDLNYKFFNIRFTSDMKSSLGFEFTERKKLSNNR